jgi:hypothetical protein
MTRDQVGAPGLEGQVLQYAEQSTAALRQVGISSIASHSEAGVTPEIGVLPALRRRFCPPPQYAVPRPNGLVCHVEGSHGF